MSQTKEYDCEEDRANDLKIHDNPSHCSKHCHDKRELSALQELLEWHLRNADDLSVPKPLTVTDYVDEGDFED